MVLKIGHRGASGHEHENTIKSFNKAIELGVDMIEMDVRRCKTGEPIIYHDRNFRKTLDETWKAIASRKSLEEIREITLGNGDQIPTLTEVLESVGRKARFKIEIKGWGITKEVVNVVQQFVNEKGWEWSDFLICSFKNRELKHVRRLSSEVPIGMMLHKSPFQFVRMAKKLNAESITINKTILDKAVIERAHLNNLKVYVFTLNTDEEIAYFKSIGVDGIISDYPDKL